MAAQNFISPKGELYWVSIDGEGKEDLNGNKRFSVSLRLKKDSPAHKEIEDKIKSFWEENKPKGINKMKSNGIKTEYEKGSDTETGYVLVNFWTGTEFPDGRRKTVGVYNAKGKEVDLGDKKIGNGSVGFVSGAMGLYKQPKMAGVTLYLNAVQLTKFVEYKGANPFGATDEDGWTGEDLNEAGFSPQEEEEQPELEGDLDY